MNKTIHPDWSGGRLTASMFAREAPVSCLFGSDDGNVLTFAVSDALDTVLIIVDDGWQTLDSARGYAYTGDWQPERMPDMKGFGSAGLGPAPGDPEGPLRDGPVLHELLEGEPSGPARGRMSLKRVR